MISWNGKNGLPWASRDLEVSILLSPIWEGSQQGPDSGAGFIDGLSSGLRHSLGTSIYETHHPLADDHMGAL